MATSYFARLAVLLFALFAGAASAQTFGLHLVSLHDEPGLNNKNPGAYVRFDNGVTLGTFKNSIGRVSFYAGYTIERGPFALTVGAISGYAIKRVEAPCNEARANIRNEGSRCYEETGGSHGAVMALVAPSVRGPEILGMTPRLTFIPKFDKNASANVLHLSVERKF